MSIGEGIAMSFFIAVGIAALVLHQVICHSDNGAACILRRWRSLCSRYGLPDGLQEWPHLTGTRRTSTRR
jgi:hypothetical protein